jgi:hypothetical protein
MVAVSAATRYLVVTFTNNISVFDNYSPKAAPSLLCYACPLTELNGSLHMLLVGWCSHEAILLY